MTQLIDVFDEPSALKQGIYPPRTSFEYYLSIGLTKYHIQKSTKPSMALQPEVLEGLRLVNPTKYNLGCKDFTMSLNNGWLNVELFANNTRQNEFLRSRSIDEEDRSVFLNCDLLNGVPALDDSLDFVYHSLLLDCFEYEQSLTLLDRIHAALKEGGKHRISVFNWDAIALAYLNKDDELFAIEDQILGSKFNPHNSNIFVPFASQISRIFYGFGIKSFWDADNLRKALLHAGFSNIAQSSCGDSPEEDIQGAEQAYSPLRQKFCLFFDCQK
jgi:hypothetical protein